MCLLRAACYNLTTTQGTLDGGAAPADGCKQCVHGHSQLRHCGVPGCFVLRLLAVAPTPQAELEFLFTCQRGAAQASIGKYLTQLATRHASMSPIPLIVNLSKLPECSRIPHRAGRSACCSASAACRARWDALGLMHSRHSMVMDACCTRGLLSLRPGGSSETLHLKMHVARLPL